MFVPNSAKEVIAKTFYDKTVDILNVTDAVDEEGGLVRSRGEVRDRFKGNIRFNNLGQVMTELGLSEAIDICITCSINTDVKLNDLLAYNDKTYQVSSIIPSDSHITIAGKLWH